MQEDCLHDNSLLNKEVNSYVSSEKLYSDIYIYIYIYIYIFNESSFAKESKVHPCTGTETLYRPYGP